MLVPIVDYETLKEHMLSVKGATLATDNDANLKRFCLGATSMFNEFADRYFVPERATYTFDHPTYDLRQIDLDKDLLELLGFTTENGATTIPTADFLLRAGKSSNFTPYDNVRLSRASDYSFSYEDDPEEANAITGIWGYHDDWANAWENSGDTVRDDPLGAAATTITASDVAGEDINGLPIRFRVQQLIKIEDEYLFITGKNKTNNKLTVRRGVNGTTAAQHAQDTPIYIYRPMPALVQAMWTFVAYLERRRAGVGTDSDRPLATAQGILVLPPRLPDEVQRALEHFRRVV